MLRSVRCWLERTGSAPPRARRRPVRQCAAQPPARRALPDRRDIRLSGDGRRRPVGRRRACASCSQRDGTSGLARATVTGSTMSISAATTTARSTTRCRRSPACGALAGAPVETATSACRRRQGRRRLSRPHGIRAARARRAQHPGKPGRRRHQRPAQQAARALRIHAVRSLCARGGRRARVRDHARSTATRRAS